MGKINTRSATFTVDGEERPGAFSSFTVTSKASDADFKTFGGDDNRMYILKATIAQDTSTGSLWNLIWDDGNTGTVTTDVLFRPFGNAVPTAEQPHFSFTCTITEPDGDFIGGKYDQSTTAVQTLDIEWDLTARPVKITTV